MFDIDIGSFVTALINVSVIQNLLPQCLNIYLHGLSLSLSSSDVSLQRKITSLVSLPHSSSSLLLNLMTGAMKLEDSIEARVL